MAAAAFKGSIQFIDGAGRRDSVNIAVSDVAGAAVTFGASGASDYQFPMGATIVDVLLDTGGTDTTNMDVMVNDKYTGYVIQNKANLTTNYSRQVMVAPFGIVAGGRLRLVQRA